MSGKRGPLSKGYQASRDKYKCPVEKCNSSPYGYEIKKHFQKCSNLLVLDKANANQSILHKSALQALEVSEQSEQYLKDLLVQATNTEKMHTIYLFQHGYSSTKLPDFNSVNFKNQQKQMPISPYFLPKS